MRYLMAGSDHRRNKTEVEDVDAAETTNGRAVGGGVASSAQHINQMSPRLLLGRLGMGTEQCAVVVISSRGGAACSCRFLVDYSHGG